MEEMKPIFRDDRKQPGLPCPDKVPVPAVPRTRLGWTDYLAMGSRRVLKTALYGGGAAVVISGIGAMFGVPFLPALKGAALAVGGTSLMMGAGKIGEEKIKQDGGTPTMEKIICAIVTAVITAIQKWQATKKGGAK